MALEEELNAAWEKYLQEVDRIGMAHLRAEVFPLLKRRKYRAVAGNGTYAVFDRNGKLLESDPTQRRKTFGYKADPEWDAVCNLLNTLIPGLPLDIGSQLCDYPQSKDDN